MRAVILSAALFVLNVAFNLSLAKGWADSVPNWFVIALWITPLVPLVWWAVTHDKLTRQREWIKERFIKEPYSSTVVVIVVALVVLLSIASAGYRTYVAFSKGSPGSGPAAVSHAPVTQLQPQQTPNTPQQQTTSAPAITTPKEKKKKSPDSRQSRPSASTSGDNSPAVGSVTQGAGSAFSVNQQGGITAGTFIGHVDPEPRRLSDTQVADLTFAAAQHPYKAFILYLQNDQEAYRIAKQIYGALHAAGWTFKQDVTPAEMMSEDGKPLFGMVVTFHGDAVPSGTPVKLKLDEPGGAVASQLFHMFPKDFHVQPLSDDSGYIVISVYTNPNAEQ